MQPLKDLFGEDSWRRENADLYQSDHALQWKLRDEPWRRELIERDGLVFHGHKWKATEKLRGLVLEIAKRESLAALCGAGDGHSAVREAA